MLWPGWPVWAPAYNAPARPATNPEAANPRSFTDTTEKPIAAVAGSELRSAVSAAPVRARRRLATAKQATTKMPSTSQA